MSHDHTPPLIVGLGHTARVGKDALAAILVEQHGFIRLAFADALKNLVYETFSDVRDLVDEYGWDNAKEVYPKLVRQPLVDVGNACRRNLGEHVWIDAVESQIEPGGRYVISDVRYPNEVEWVQSQLRGHATKVTRRGVEPLPNVADQALVNFDGWDRVVKNDGTLLDLAAQAAKIASDLLGPVGKVESSKMKAIRRIEPL